MSDIVIIETDVLQVDVRKAAVSKRLKNIRTSGNLEQKATVSKLETVRKDSDRTIPRQVEHYNLDAIISGGYRIPALAVRTNQPEL